MAQCAKCKNDFPSDVIEKHHPDKIGFPDWTIRLCANCHRQVTNEQNRQRNKGITLAKAPSWYRNLFVVPPKQLLQRRYDVRVASPRKLFRILHDYLQDSGYIHNYEPLKIEPGAIEGTATFNSELKGEKSWTKTRRSWLKLILGLILCLTIVLIPMGIRLMRKTQYVVAAIAAVSIEGEAYLAKGRPQELDKIETEEVLDVVSDARVTLEVRIGATRDQVELTEKELTEDRELTEDNHRTIDEFQKLQHELAILLPKVSLPQTKATEANTQES